MMMTTSYALLCLLLLLLSPVVRSSISSSSSSGSSVSHHQQQQQQQQQDRSHQLFLRGGHSHHHRDLVDEREKMKKVDRDRRGDNGNSRVGGSGSGNGADSSITTANANNGSNVNNGNNVKTTTSTSSSLCTPVTVLDSIPFIYTKNMFISYELEAVDESTSTTTTTTTNEDEDESNKKFLDFHNTDINTDSNKELLLQTILQDSFIQAYNELVTDCPIFNDTTEDSHTSPTRELHDSYFLFGYDHNDDSQNKLDTTPDDFTTSFILMSLDLKCSYCQEDLSLLQQGQGEEEGLLLNSNDDSCMISLFDYQQEQISIRNPSCSCGIPSNDEFLIEYANKINNNDLISSMGMKIKFDQITEIKVEQSKEQEPALDVDVDVDEAITTTSNNEQQQESLPVLGWDVPIEISPVSVGCLPSAFVLKEDEQDNEEIQGGDEQPIKISRTTGSYNNGNGSGSGSGRKCEHLSISNGMPLCGSGTTTTTRRRTK